MSMRLLTLLSLSSALALTACGDKDGGDDDDGGDGDGGGDTGTELVDADEDGYDASIDCDDSDPAVHPDATEICNGIDDDCDDQVDDDDPDVDLTDGADYYADSDGDGFGDPDAQTRACAQPADHVTDDTDCDDSLDSVFPGADEYCNEIDDDCDDETDEPDAVDATTWYADADEDGYGDPESSVQSCTPVDLHVDNGEDCDDADAWSYPGATELCDGVDNDCDSATPDEGIATWWPADGDPTDITDGLSGSDGDPALYSFEADGTATVCPGTWYANIGISADVTLQGGGDDPAAVVLDGDRAGPVVAVTAGAGAVEIADLTITHGSNSTAGEILTGLGGGIHCEDPDLAGIGLTISGAIIEDNYAHYGGGIGAVGCIIEVDGTELAWNEAGTFGGGFMAYYGDLDMTDVEVRQNTSDDVVAGGFAYGLTGEEEFTFDGVAFTSNSASGYVGGMGVQYGTLVWTGSTESPSSVTENEDDDFGAGLYLFGADADISGVDFGEPGSEDDNSPWDIYAEDVGYQYNAGDDATFTCTAWGGCGEVTETIVNEDGGYEWTGYEGYLNGIVFQADGEDTLMGWQFYGYADSSCSSTFTLLSADSVPSSASATDFDVEWSTTVTPPSTADWFGPTTLGDVVEDGRYYALAYECSCSDSGDYCDTEHDGGVGTAAESTGLGETVGFVYGAWDGTGTDVYFYNISDGIGELFMTKVHSTSL